MKPPLPKQVEDPDHEGVDMEASLSAILDSKTTDRKQRLGRATLFYKSSLKISRSESKPPRKFMKVWRAFLAGFCHKRQIYTARKHHSLRTPEVNPLIWSEQSATMKAQDARSQKGQNPHISSVIAMTKATNLVLAKYSQDRDLIFNSTTKLTTRGVWQ